jgi:hypothetical protein
LAQLRVNKKKPARFGNGPAFANFGRIFISGAEKSLVNFGYCQNQATLERRANSGRLRLL